jgi:hypothetical protein
MMVANDPLKYEQLSKYSILDYYTYVEAVSVNTAKMNKDGQSKNKVRGR